MAKSGRPERIGRYEIRSLLGQGMMGEVYRAHDPWIDRTVAIKVFRAGAGLSLEEQAVHRARVLAEARAAGRLDHPNIVRILDCAEDDDGDPYIVMEYLAGPSLATVMRDYKVRQDDALRILEQLSSAVDAAHAQGVVHRDIKPANVLFNEEGDTAKIADFGIAQVDDSRATQDMRQPATPVYMAPEQAAGGTADARSDLFSFGVMGYELLAGRPPFGGGDAVSLAYQVIHEPPPPITEVARDLPAPVDGVMSRILDKNPERRFATAREFCEALRGALQPATPAQPPSAECGPEAMPSATTERVPGAPRPSRTKAAGSALIDVLRTRRASLGEALGRRRAAVVRILPWAVAAFAVFGWLLWPRVPREVVVVHEPATTTSSDGSSVEVRRPVPAPAVQVEGAASTRGTPAPALAAKPTRESEPGPPKPKKTMTAEATRKSSRPTPTPALVVHPREAPVTQPAPAVAPPEPVAPKVAAPPGHLSVKLRHRISAGTLRVFVDGQPVLREEFSKRKFDPVKVSEFAAVDVEPGTHQITAHVMGAKGKTYGSVPVAVRVESGHSLALKIAIRDDHLQLTAE